MLNQTQINEIIKQRENEQCNTDDIQKACMDAVSNAETKFIDYLNSEYFEPDLNELIKETIHDDGLEDLLQLDLYIDCSINRYSNKKHPCLGFVFGGNNSYPLRRDIEDELPMPYNRALFVFLCLVISNFHPFEKFVDVLDVKLKDLGYHCVGISIRNIEKYSNETVRLPISVVLVGMTQK